MRRSIRHVIQGFGTGFLAAVLTITSTTSAFAGTADQIVSGAKAVLKGNTLSFEGKMGSEFMGAEISMTSSKSILIDGLNAEGKIARTVEIPNPTAAQVAADRPSKWMAFRGAMAGALAHTKKEFLPQSFLFLVALGALSARDMVYNSDENPASWAQLLDNQTDPVGQAGFAAFIFANTTSSELLRSAIQNPALRTFAVPALGMSVGMMANKIVSELGHLNYSGIYNTLTAHGLQAMMEQCKAQGHPEVCDDDYLKKLSRPQAILKTMEECRTLKHPKTCDDAYYMFMDAMHGHPILNQAPALMGMLSATALIAAVKWAGSEVVVRTASMAAERGSTWMAARLIGFQMITTFNEVGLAVKFVQGVFWVAQAAEIAGFIDISGKIENKTRVFWKNWVTTGYDLSIGKTKLELHLNKLTNNIYNQDLEALGIHQEIEDDLHLIASDMADFRQNNAFRSVNEYNNWMMAINNLAAGYNYSELFYGTFLGTLWNIKFDHTKADPDLYRTYPFMGVKGKTGAVFVSTDYASTGDGTANDVENSQFFTIETVAQKMAKDLADPHGPLTSLFAPEKAILQQIQGKLASKNRLTIADGLDQLNDLAQVGTIAAHLIGAADEVKYAREIHDLLGDPHPCRTPGQGFMRILNMMAQEGKYHLPTGYDAENPAEFMMYQMLRGPDVEAGQSSLGRNLEYLSVFKPPMVRKAGELEETWLVNPQGPMSMQIAAGMGGASPVDTKLMTSLNLGVRVKPDTRPLKNVFEFLTTDGIRSSVLNNINYGADKMNPVKNWWTQKITPQYVAAWKEFAIKYQTVMQDYYVDLHRTGSAHDIPKGGLANLNSEFDLYLNTLKAIMKTNEKEMAPVYLILANAHNDMILELEKINIITVIEPDGQSHPHLASQMSEKKLKVLTELANATLQQVNAAVEESVKAGRHTESWGRMMTALLLHLGDSFSEINNAADVMNAVSYKWKYTDGIYQSGPCLKAVTSTGGAEAFRKVPGCGHEN